MYECDLADIEAAGEKLPAKERIAAIRVRNQVRKDYLAALLAIGGTPFVRLRARVAPEDKPKRIDDPWSKV
jgi:hypothetical protein